MPEGLAKRPFQIFLNDSDREPNFYIPETTGVLMEDSITKIVVIYTDEHGQMSVNMHVVSKETAKEVIEKVRAEKLV